MPFSARQIQRYFQKQLKEDKKPKREAQVPKESTIGVSSSQRSLHRSINHNHDPSPESHTSFGWKSPLKNLADNYTVMTNASSQDIKLKSPSNGNNQNFKFGERGGEISAPVEKIAGLKTDRVNNHAKNKISSDVTREMLNNIKYSVTNNSSAKRSLTRDGSSCKRKQTLSPSLALLKLGPNSKKL